MGDPPVTTGVCVHSASAAAGFVNAAASGDADFSIVVCELVVPDGEVSPEGVSGAAATA